MRAFLGLFALILLSFSGVWLWQAERGSELRELSPAAGQAEVGGGFTLTDQNGRSVSDHDFRGRLMLVFFGFTHCPDICPVTIATLSKTMDLLGDDASKVAPIFITVDPARDTPAVLKDYLANFNRGITALTGTAEQTKDVTAAYKAYYAEAAPAAGPEAHGHGDHSAGHGNKDYTVNHSGFVYLMDKTGRYVRHFPYDVSDQELIGAVRQQLKE